MKKFFNKIVFIIGLFLIMISTTKAEDDIYYLPQWGSNYFKSQHTYNFKYKGNDTEKKDYRPVVSDLIKKGAIDKYFDYTDFKDNFNIPWQVSDTKYVLVLCSDLETDVVDLAEYRRVPIEDSTYVPDEAKAHITGMLRASYPFLPLEEAINRLVDAKILTAKEVDGKTYYTSPLNDQPTRTITEHEFVSALQMAIFYYSNPGQVTDIYYRTSPVRSNTVLAYSDTRFKPEEAYGSSLFNPWTTSQTSTMTEVENNITTLYNYFLTLEGSNESLKIESATINKNGDEYTIYVRTNRELNTSDDIDVIVHKGTTNIGEYKLNKFTKEDENLYKMSIGNVENVDQAVEVSFSGNEYSQMKAYAYEAIKGKDTAQTFVGLSSGSISLPVEKVADVTFEVTPPDTNSFVSIGIVAILGISILSVIYFSSKKKFYN